MMSISNNNPGNMKAKGAFQKFDTPKAGLDAMQNDLMLKLSGQSPVMRAKFGENYQPTVRNVISTWAPPAENNTDGYINFVAQHAGLDPDQPLSPADVPKIMQPMVHMEGGQKAASYFGKLMGDIGNAVIPSAQAGDKEITDPNLLAQLNGPQEVTDPALLAQLDGTPGIKDILGTIGDSSVGQAIGLGGQAAKEVVSDIFNTFNDQPQQTQLPTADMQALQQKGWSGTSTPEKVGAFEEALMTSPPGKMLTSMAATPAGAIISAGLGKVNQAAEENLGIPHQYSQAAEMLLPLAKGAPKAIANKVNALEAKSQAIPGLIGDVSGSHELPAIMKPQQPLPQGMEGLATLPDASKGTMLAKQPNELKVGMVANNKISAAFDAESQKVNQLYKNARNEGNFTVIAPETYSKLDDLVSHLKDKVAPGSKEHMALLKLSEIKDNIAQKYGTPAQAEKVSPIVDSSGVAFTTPAKSGVDAYGISPADLIEIKQAINSAVSSKKFVTAGGGKLLNFKSYVNDALKNAGDIKPSFKTALGEAEKGWAALSRKFISNDELRPFWTPEDHLAWKTNQNNPSAPAFTDSTLSRAEKFLKNLNSKSAGRVSAVGNILSPQEASALFKQALVAAKGNKASFIKSGAQLVTGHPVRAAGTLFNAATKTQEQPLESLAKQIKQIRRK